MDKKLLKLTCLEQRNLFEQTEDFVIRRRLESKIKTKKITVISGVRRSGKSTLLYQISQEYKGYYYLNFEDERLLDFTYSDFNNLYEIFMENFGEQKIFFLDEIQNILGWEKFVRRLFSAENKVFITRSNAKLLSSELSTSLTGRYQKIELFPFSFKEFLDYQKFDLKKFYTTKEKGLLKKYFNQYLEFGGFPEVVESQDKNELIQLYQDILINDLIVRFRIKDIKSFRELALYLLSNTASLVSFNNLKKILGLNSTTTVKNHIEFLEESYLNFTIPKFDYSLKKQIINDKKIFSIDTGLVRAVSFAFSENYGQLLENIVFLELKRRGKEIYYYLNKQECDFVIKRGRKIIQAIQVTKNLLPRNKDREISGLLAAMEKYNLKQGLILTDDLEDEIKINNKKIAIKPVYEWLLGD